MRQLLWQSMLDADMNLRYWDEIMRRRILGEQRLRIVQMVLSSGTVAAWLFAAQLDWLWKALSCVTACLSTYLYIAGTSKPLEKLAGLKKTYSACLVDYEHLWAQVDGGMPEPRARQKLEALRRRQYNETIDESHFPVDGRLLRACHAAVRHARNC